MGHLRDCINRFDDLDCSCGYWGAIMSDDDLKQFLAKKHTRDKSTHESTLDFSCHKRHNVKIS